MTRALDAIAVLAKTRIYCSADAFHIPAHAAQIGDLLDLEGDSVSDTPENDRAHGFPFELAEVEAVEDENGDRIVIHTTQGSYAFPRGHLLGFSLERNAPANFYQCGTCDHLHPVGWGGDCRDDCFRFTASELDDELGPQDSKWWITDENGHDLA